MPAPALQPLYSSAVKPRVCHHYIDIHVCAHPIESAWDEFALPAGSMANGKDNQSPPKAQPTAEEGNTSMRALVANEYGTNLNQPVRTMTEAGDSTGKRAQ